ncbi:hypothetical protein G3A39_42820 [Paraburkholderia aspalathi]|nr:hypothetical protein [Paraburkholderia aspalathi]
MAKFNYAKSQATAQRLLTKFGREIIITRKLPGTGPPHNPADPTLITYQATAAILPASKGKIEAFDNRLEGGTLIDEKLRYVLMSPKLTRTSAAGPDTIEPQSLDVLTVDGHDWTVLGCTPLNPADVPVLFPMGVKR